MILTKMHFAFWGLQNERAGKDLGFFYLYNATIIILNLKINANCIDSFKLYFMVFIDREIYEI